MNPPATLDAWLAYVERLHSRPMELGLERVRAVADRMGLRWPCATIVVGGTNGKGSTCAMLDAILRAAGFRVGKYASPHLLRFVERAQIDGRPVAEPTLLAAFAAVERARGDTPLTYFEFTTLAAFSCFAGAELDCAVLEVGLGGRLDAVNIVDADCAIVTTVDLDHMEWLGGTREAIGAEKAHIYRAGRPAICVDPDPPASLRAVAADLGADLWCLGRDFAVADVRRPPEPAQWTYRGRAQDRAALPWPALRGEHQLRNAAGALAALEALADRLPVDQQAVRVGLRTVTLPGRYQVLPGRPALVFDVAHNPHAARALAQALRAHGPFRRTCAVFGMLADKDAQAVVAALRDVIDVWHLAGTTGARGRDAQSLARAAFGDDAGAAVFHHDSVAAALDAAAAEAGPDDRIVTFGSFVIVADALRWAERGSR